MFPIIRTWGFLSSTLFWLIQIASAHTTTSLSVSQRYSWGSSQARRNGKLVSIDYDVVALNSITPAIRQCKLSQIMIQGGRIEITEDIAGKEPDSSIFWVDIRVRRWRIHAGRIKFSALWFPESDCQRRRFFWTPTKSPFDAGFWSVMCSTGDPRRKRPQYSGRSFSFWAKSYEF